MKFSLSENIKCVAVAVFFVVLAGGYWWWEHRPEPEEKETVTEALVVVTKSTNACFSDLVRVTGFVVARREAVVGPDQEGSKVTDLFIREGDSVTDNQELARLSAPPQQPGQQQRSSSSGPVSLRAPAPGLVTEVRTAVGAPASPQAGPMFRIAINNEIELDAEVPSVHMPKLNPGVTARITRDNAPDLIGRVRLVSPQIDRNTQLGHVRIAVTNNPTLKIGQFARASIDAKRSCGVAIPHTAIDHLTVQVIKGNVVETRKGRVGLSSDTSTEILEGLDVGEIVVADAGSSLHDGDQVKTMFSDEIDRRGPLMALNISAWSIRNPLPSVVFSIILVVLGWLSFGKLAVTHLPSADIPVISVAVAQFGAAPTELESQVTKIIEDGVSGVEGVRHINSSITDGLSVTTIAFSIETNTDRAINDIKDAVTRVRANLPQHVNEPLIQRVDVIGLPIVTYAAISPGKTPEQLSYFVDDVVKRELQGVRGVAEVQRIGGVEREILVSLDPDKLQAAGLTAVNVGQHLRGTNEDLAGGRAEIGRNDQAIRTLAGAKTLNDLAGTMIPLFGGGEMRIDDLGTVTDTIADRRTFARANGEPVVAFAIKRAKGASDVVVAAAVQKRIDAIKEANPEYDLRMIDTSVKFTRGNYEAAISTLFEGAILAVIIVMLFLRDIRATLIAAVSLPLSIFPAFWAMDILGFSLNLISFLAITLSTGILVDDAIVEIENIVRHMRMGKSPYRAALEAADEIGLAVIAISLTIIAIFTPASFMSGVAGQFFKQFGITVSVQVFFSLLVARFVTPVLAAYFLKDHAHDDPPPGRALKGYNKLVTWSVRHYFITVLIGLGIFAASIWSISLLPQSFLPAQDSARSRLGLELPPGTQLAYTEKVTEDIVALLRKRPEVKSVFVDGGRDPKGSQEVRRATLIINYTPKTLRSITQRELENAIGRDLDDVPDTRYWFLDDNGNR